ncbi:MAG: uridine diphosphate-N-acetylglucosamine-binding protein YvcK [Candidatus Nealsonbacteria bacterium]|nr:uridine diphosphate-N-acetylglucosamine-binding protein YvcK [Candidatus Nealsonbacteria bacterium]
MSKRIKQKHIVCLGGGNAMPKAVLAGLKHYPVRISAVCAMLDTGGSAGRLRKDYGIVSPGDIRRAFLALANTSPIIENLFNYRFEDGQLKGHNLANLFITALELATNDYQKVLSEMSKFLNVAHQVLPVTLEKSTLFAVLANGKIISGETNIDKPKHDGRLKIKKVFLRPQIKAYSPSLKAIREADLIVIGPGDLYSSLAQILLTEGVARAVRQSRAKTVYVCNLVTKYGETNDFSVQKFSDEIEKYLGSSPDYVVYNNFVPPASRIKKYFKDHPELISLVKIDDNLNEAKFIGANLFLKSGPLEHDSQKLAKIITGLV